MTWWQTERYKDKDAHYMRWFLYVPVKRCLYQLVLFCGPVVALTERPLPYVENN